MRLKDVVIQGKFCGLETVEECILNFELHTMQMLPPNALEFECRELIKDIQAYEKGELKLNWKQINEAVKDDLKEYNKWLRKNASASDDETLDFTLRLIK